MTTNKLTEVKDELTKAKVTGFLSKISKVEIERIRRMRHIYRGKNVRKTKQRLCPEAELTRMHHVSEALNEWRLQESLINDLPTPLNQKIVSP